MSFLYRRTLSEDLINDSISDSLCKSDCDDSNLYSGVCRSLCHKICPDICRFGILDASPQVPYHDHKNSKRISIISASAIVSAIFLACIIFMFFKSRSRSRSSSSSGFLAGTDEETLGEFLDEERGPTIDHPIWYIRTVGLQPSVIDSIGVFQYKTGEGLVEGTDCSVCLSEFEEDETLRLLPKCSHAFHVPCIDTWLRSHVNCPLCRAPIVVTAEISSSGTSNLQRPDEVRVSISEENGEESERNEREREVQVCGDDDDGDVVVSVEAQEDGTQRVRRSVSLDSLSALRFSEAVVYATKGKESDSGKRENAAEKMKRSVSCSGKFLLPRYM